ncbi:MAG: penicillin-binding protein 2 [Deltaproteobacteria bacterium]|nr:penicillin-binding protein 2 [Deltaproteobacteria bacterium]
MFFLIVEMSKYFYLRSITFHLVAIAGLTAAQMALRGAVLFFFGMSGASPQGLPLARPGRSQPRRWLPDLPGALPARRSPQLAAARHDVVPGPLVSRMWETSDFADAPNRSHTTVFIVVIVAFVFLLAKLWFLQVIQGADLRKTSERQQIRDQRMAAPRGIIRDRSGELLTQNRPSYNLFFRPAQITSSRRLEVLEAASAEWGFDLDVAKRRLAASRGWQPIKIKTDISREEVARIETRGMVFGPNFPFEIEAESMRVYPLGSIGAHLLGYCDEIDAGRLELPEYADYRPGDLVGKTGIEEFYEKDLAGVYGHRRVEVNARGTAIREFETERGEPGRNLVLNVDKLLMETAHEALGEGAGSVVALDPRTGAVLAAVSTPGFKPEIFSRPIPHDLWNGFLSNKKTPLLNKFISGMYPPGSTFKLVTALAGLESGAIHPKDVVYCPGKWHFGGRDFRCHNAQGHGYVNLHTAIVHSCDVYFYKMGFQMGIGVIAEYARALGFGDLTGIDVVGEKGGVVPDRKWKSETQKERWLPGDTLNVSDRPGVSQGNSSTDRFGVCRRRQRGTLYRPRVVDRIEDSAGAVVRDIEPEVLRELPVSKKNLQFLSRAFFGVVHDPGGTGGRGRISGVHTAGKTGTSQVRGIKKVRLHVSQVPYEARDHALFAAYAPYENPEILVTAVVEHSGHGGVVAAPVAAQVMRAWFRAKGRRDVDKPVALGKKTRGTDGLLAAKEKVQTLSPSRPGLLRARQPIRGLAL